MKHKLLVSLCLLTLFSSALFSQTYQQYFDGADTAAWNSLLIELDPDTNNIWQVGPPMKTLFDTAFSTPNVIVTDTLNLYPAGNHSEFTFKVPVFPFFTGILAMQWMQKLDMEKGKSGGWVDFSLDAGASWEPAFNNPYVYNYYGYDLSNVDTLSGGRNVFSGLDTTWKNIWLCMDGNWLVGYDTLLVRYTFESDTTTEGGEGWMIDNLLTTLTFQHTLVEGPTQEKFQVYPTTTDGRVYIKATKTDEFQIIETIDVVNTEGRVVMHKEKCPTKFYLDLQDQAAGLYFIRVRTTLFEETRQIILQH